jgi:hypothetical protein
MPDTVPKSLLQKMNSLAQRAESWKPHPYQERSLKFLLENPQSGLFLDPGLGKSAITLAALKILLAKKLVRRCLVVVQVTPLYEVWPLEVRKWKEFHGIGVAMLHGSDKDRTLRNLQPEHQLVLCTPEGLDWLVGNKANRRLLDADMLVIDESSKFKNSNTVRFRRLRTILGEFKRRHILTGSPRPKNYLDLFSQVLILDRGAALGQYVTSYRHQFFYPTGYMGLDWAPLPDAPKEINKLVAPLVLRLDGEDYLKLPTILPPKNHVIDLPPAVRKQYDELEKGMVLASFAGGKEAARVASTAASARSKCCQLAQGSVYRQELGATEEFGGHEFRLSTTTVEELHTEKCRALGDLLDELQGEPLLLAIGYRHDVTAIRKHLKYEVPCIHGGTTRKQASELLAEWNAGKLDLLLGHPASMGHGLNMQGCHGRHVGYYCLPDDFDQYDQFYKRVRRQGNKAGFVMRHHFIARGTVDEAKLENLRRKGNGQRDFMKAMKDYAQAKGLLKGL